MTLKIAVTRAEAEAHSTAQRIRARGGEAIIAPLLTIVPKPFDTSLDGVQAILFTSINAVAAFARATPQRGRPVLTVGDASAEAARAAGFAQVRSADGDVGALADLARAALDPAHGKLLHIAGSVTAGDLTGALRQAGYDAEQRAAFDAEVATALPPALTQPLDVILFHSARACGAFVDLGAPNAGSLTAACLGPRIAETAGAVRWKRLIVAPAPREEALLDAAFAA